MERLNDVGLVVLDEVHYLGDPSRGSVWEEVIINCPAHIQLCAMSATVANADDLGAWIDEVIFLLHHLIFPLSLLLKNASHQGLHHRFVVTMQAIENGIFLRCSDQVYASEGWLCSCVAGAWQLRDCCHEVPASPVGLVLWLRCGRLGASAATVQRQGARSQLCAAAL